jgi:1-deoxy-D-xylulose-5-phosphate reductoisomerase
VVLNAVNEIAVAGFLDGRSRFMDIPRLIADALDALGGTAVEDLEACLELDAEARRWAEAALAGSVKGALTA